MSASDYDSRLLDNERRKNDELQAENDGLRKEIARLNWAREQQFRRMRDIMGETG